MAVIVRTLPVVVKTMSDVFRTCTGSFVLQKALSCFQVSPGGAKWARNEHKVGNCSDVALHGECGVCVCAVLFAKEKRTHSHPRVLVPEIQEETEAETHP